MNYIITDSDILDILNHVITLSNNATLLFNHGYFSTACFLAITSIEECAKLYEFNARFRTSHSRTFSHSELMKLKWRKNKRYNIHILKQIVAILKGLMLNTRAIHNYGRENVERLKSLAKSGKLFDIRNASLYVDFHTNRFRLPEDIFKQRDLQKDSFNIIGLTLEIVGSLSEELSGDYLHISKKLQLLSKNMYSESDVFCMSRYYG